MKLKGKTGVKSRCDAALNRSANALLVSAPSYCKATYKQRTDAGNTPDLAETQHIREGEWQIQEIPKDLQDRRVEITGPVDRKMIINAL